MDVNSFLGALKPPGEVTTGESREEPVSPPAPVVISDTTPSGIVVEYEAKPKRLYRVNGVEVPSVTIVLDVLSKPALTWYGQRMGIQGVLDLFDMGVLTSGFDWDTDKERVVVLGEDEAVDAGYADEKTITALLTHHKLTVNHRTDKAATRGTNVHDALETWGTTGELPSPGDFPETEAGYVKGLVRFLEDARPIPVRQEVMVGSAEHGFAGRFDLVADVPECEVTTRCYPKRGDKRTTIAPGELLLDLKTSKSTYPSHHLQLAAYELAAVEGGYPATTGQAIVHVTEDGKYELVFSVATPEHFLAVKQAHDALKELPK